MNNQSFFNVFSIYIFTNRYLIIINKSDYLLINTKTNLPQFKANICNKNEKYFNTKI